MKKLITLVAMLLVMITPCYAIVTSETVAEPTAPRTEENTQAVAESSASVRITTADNLAVNDPSLYEIEWGGTSDSGFTWGLERLAKVLERNCGTPCNFVNAQKISNTSYIVTIESTDPWRNGNFQVDLVPTNTQIPNDLMAGVKLFDQYDGWFGYYNRSTKDPNEISHLATGLYKRI